MGLLQNWANGDLIDLIRDITNTAINTIGKSTISATDTTFGHLLSKLVAGTGITLTQNSIGGDETITINGPDISTKVSVSSIITESIHAVGPTAFNAETTMSTLTPSLTLNSAKMKYTFSGYVQNASGSVGAATIRIKKNGVQIGLTKTVATNTYQTNFCMIIIDSYIAGDIITATITSLFAQNANEYTLICEANDAI